MTPTRPFVDIAPLGGSPIRLHPGDVIGRTPGAAWCLDDPRVSELHAYVSLRGGRLMLLGLRGRLMVDGSLVAETPLRAGQEIQLAPSLAVQVRAVRVPSQVLAVVLPGQPSQVLTQTCAVTGDHGATLVPGFHPQAPLQFWSQGTTWRVRDPDGSVHEAAEGQAWSLQGGSVRIVSLATHQASATTTRDGLGAPLHIQASFDTVHITRQDGVSAMLVGRGAQVVSELIALGGTAPWDVLAGEIWGREEPAARLRPRFDVTVQRLRKKLSDAGLSSDLVCPTGAGQLTLRLRPHDVVESDG